jgi:hypothetical protein
MVPFLPVGLLRDMPARDRSLDSNESRNQGIPEARRNNTSEQVTRNGSPEKDVNKIGQEIE